MRNGGMSQGLIILKSKIIILKQKQTKLTGIYAVVMFASVLLCFYL